LAGFSGRCAYGVWWNGQAGRRREHGLSAALPVSGRDLLEIWERCGAEAPVERSLSILELGYPGMARAEIETLDIRARDRLLLDLRAATMGAEIEGRLQCPHCGEWLEFTLAADMLGRILGKELCPLVHASSCGAYQIHLRPIDSRELARAAGARDLAAARRALFERSVDVRDRDGRSVPAETLPAELQAEAMGLLEALQAECEILLDFDCAACGAKHSHVFDAGAFFWLEISQTARHLLDDVHQLAWAYGWPESEILAMSSRRRQAYLDRVWQ
jgi:hypothetical protein